MEAYDMYVPMRMTTSFEVFDPPPELLGRIMQNPVLWTPTSWDMEIV